MKLQLDTTQKVIKVEEAVNLGELIDLFERLLPNGLWKEFKLETHTVINWTPTPIIISPYTPPFPQYPTYPWVTYGDLSTGTGTAVGGDGHNNLTLNNGVYSIEACMPNEDTVVALNV